MPCHHYRNRIIDQKNTLYRSLPIFALLFLFILLINTPHRKFDKIKESQSNFSNINHVSPERDFSKLVKERRKVLVENRDEFLNELLKELSFTEVDLISISRRNDPESDRSIQIYLNKIVPGLGENATEAKVPPEKVEEAERVLQEQYLNKILSDMIAFNRSLPDFREPECKINYDLNQLPSLSIIIIFVNEPFSLLVRTLHSVFNRTPESLLREVVLVDDFSDHSDLHGVLLRYLVTRFPLEKIRLIRLSQRSGLIRARMMGAHVAVGEVLMFLDAHCEVTDGWAEPILQRIKTKRTAVISPVVDEVDRVNFKYYIGADIMIGVFGWELKFKYADNKRPKWKRDFSPMDTPTIIGGLFGIERRYFWEIGSYDPGMLIWGGENLEMSFRIWQCGGSLEIIPCSRVGHVFRKNRPNSVPAEILQDALGLNTARLAEVWMDQYKELHYKYSPRLSTYESKWTNITLRRKFRERKKCESFQWYLDNVCPDVFTMELESKFYGQLKNKGANECLDRTAHAGEFLLETFSCHGKLFPSQTFYFSNKDELRLEEECATISNFNRVKMIPCKNHTRDRWLFLDGQIFNILTLQCLTLMVNPNTKDVTHKFITGLEQCSDNSLYQKWELNNFSNVTRSTSEKNDLNHRNNKL